MAVEDLAYCRYDPLRSALVGKTSGITIATDLQLQILGGNPMGNHWNDSGDLVVEEKTLFRQVGWLREGHFYPLAEGLPESYGATITPVYQQISTWVEG